MLIRHVDAVVYAVRLPEIERTAVHVAQDVRAELGVVLYACICFYLKEMVHYIAAFIALEVEICMVGEIHYRRFVGGRLVLDSDSVAVCQPICYIYIHGARKTLLSVRTDSVELDASASIFLYRRGIPDESVETHCAAMALNRLSSQFLIGDQFVPRTVQSECGVIDPVPEPADDRTDESVFLLEIFNVSESDDHIAVMTFPVRHHDADNAGAIIKKLHRSAASVGYGI